MNKYLEKKIIGLIWLALVGNVLLSFNLAFARRVREDRSLTENVEWLFVEDRKLKEIVEQYLSDSYFSYIFEMIKEAGGRKIYIIEDEERAVAAIRILARERRRLEQQYGKELEEDAGALYIDDRLKIWPAGYARLVLEHENWHIYMDFEHPEELEKYNRLLEEWKSFYPEDAVERLGWEAVNDGINFLPRFIRGGLSNIALARFQIQKGFREVSAREIRKTVIVRALPDLALKKKYLKQEFILYYSRTVLPFEIEAELKRSQGGSQEEIEQLERYR